ncbi:DNA repair protein RecO, partial [Faecalibacterium prausnitzii]
MQKLESRGFILFNRNYRENDKLVKIFTKQAGKRMFFVIGGGSGKLSAVILDLN